MRSCRPERRKERHPFKWNFLAASSRTMRRQRVHSQGNTRGIVDRHCDLQTVGWCRIRYGDKQIKLIPFICDTLDDIPLLSEHIAFKMAQSGRSWKDRFFWSRYYCCGTNISGRIKSAEQANNISGSAQQTYNEEDLRSMVENMMGCMKPNG